MSEEKIVVTAVSSITPLGNSISEITEKLIKGISGISVITRYDLNDFPVRHGGQIDDSILNKISYPFEKVNLQFKLFYYCVNELFSKIAHNYTGSKIGCALGTDPNTSTIDDLQVLFKRYHDTTSKTYSKFDVTKLDNINPSFLMYHLSKNFGVNGPCLCNLGTCSASTQAIGTAYRLLQNKTVDMMIAGGVSSKTDPISIARLCRLEALEPTREDLNENCRPFDKKREGFTIAEGCVLFVLERESDALRRNAEILCEISGYGAALDGFSITDPHAEAKGMVWSMERAIYDSGISKDAIDYINAHGTATVKNDSHETKAIKKVFGEKAYNISISSTKSMHGHLMTAAGAMEVLDCIIAIKNKFIPPTIKYSNLDEECDLDYTPNVYKRKVINHALTNSFGLGGQNASLIVSKY
ncbi:MAG: beta-ketoacyl-[acyl-carrier-protein] synthase family protein [Endomicrobium sp.]|jgi:3-oxoacyl-(acyl-carrier-protein) synthase|nr:beta-ketoacyl-[acyl-carrier-protein] synthase family protein [Endomicrobium sp.]